MEPSRLMRLAPSREGCLLPLGWASGVQLQFLPARSPEDFSDSFTAIKREGAQALVILGDPMFSLNAEPFARLALENQLPTVDANRRSVEAGSLDLGPAILRCRGVPLFWSIGLPSPKRSCPQSTQQKLRMRGLSCAVVTAPRCQ